MNHYLYADTSGLYTETASANQYLNYFLFHHSVEPFDERLYSGIVLQQVFELLEDCYGVIYFKTTGGDRKDSIRHCISLCVYVYVCMCGGKYPLHTLCLLSWSLNWPGFH